MTHTHVRKNLLLFLDGSLPDEEMHLIRHHLSVCPGCAEQHAALASLWQSESRHVKILPPPFLWTRLQVQIKETEHTSTFIWPVKSAVHRMRGYYFSILAVIAAIILGMYVGAPHDSQRNHSSLPMSQSSNRTDELGLNQFDVIPPETLGSQWLTTAFRETQERQPLKETK
jgi:hypothetical protein